MTTRSPPAAIFVLAASMSIHVPASAGPAESARPIAATMTHLSQFMFSSPQKSSRSSDDRGDNEGEGDPAGEQAEIDRREITGQRIGDRGRQLANACGQEKTPE